MKNKIIFKSHQVNLDKEPWESINHGGRGATALVYDDMKYRPRPEFEPTRDPEPYARDDGWRERAGAAHLQGRGYGWAPRREQFDTPVNRVLVAFREEGGTAQHWLDHSLTYEVWGEDATPNEIEHALKVLRRLAHWTNE
jgi:hypothetical protein